MKITPETAPYIPIVLTRLFETYAHHMTKADRLAAAACVRGLDAEADVDEIAGEPVDTE